MRLCTRFHAFPLAVEARSALMLPHLHYHRRPWVRRPSAPSRPPTCSKHLVPLGRDPRRRLGAAARRRDPRPCSSTEQHQLSVSGPCPASRVLCDRVPTLFHSFGSVLWSHQTSTIVAVRVSASLHTASDLAGLRIHLRKDKKGYKVSRMRRKALTRIRARDPGE